MVIMHFRWLKSKPIMYFTFSHTSASSPKIQNSLLLVVVLREAFNTLSELRA